MAAQKPFAFDESGFANVMKKAKAENKPVFYMIYASWCPHCHKMREEVFPDTRISDLINGNFIAAAQDVELDAGRALARKFNVALYPTFVVLDSDGELLYGFSGELKKEDFIKEVNDALDPEKQLPYLRKAFANEPSDGNRSLALILAMRKSAQPASDVAKRYLATQNDEQLISALNWKIIANGLTDIGSREFQHVIAHQKEFASVASEKRVARKIENAVSETLKPLAERADSASYNKQRNLIRKFNVRSADSLVYVYDKIAYERAKDWTAYRNSTIKATSEFSGKDYTALRNVAAVYEAQLSDEKALMQAVGWATRSLELQESKEGYFVLSKLYLKLKDNANAAASARSGRGFCERVGFGTKEFDEILNRLQSK